MFSIGTLKQNHLDILYILKQIGFELKGAGTYNSQNHFINLKEGNSSELGKKTPTIEDLYFLKKVTNKNIIIN